MELEYRRTTYSVSTQLRSWVQNWEFHWLLIRAKYSARICEAISFFYESPKNVCLAPPIIIFSALSAPSWRFHCTVNLKPSINSHRARYLHCTFILGPGIERNPIEFYSAYHWHGSFEPRCKGSHLSWCPYSAWQRSVNIGLFYEELMHCIKLIVRLCWVMLVSWRLPY